MSGWSDALGVVEKLAPTIASTIGGPLAGMGITALENLFGLTPKLDASTDDRQAAVAAAISGATPEQLAAMRKADQDFAARMAEAGFKDVETIAALNVQDRSSARDMQVSTRSLMPPILGGAIIAGSLAAAAAILAGKVAYVNTTEATMVGTVIGYLFSEAKAVLSFYFGDTQASARKTELIAQGAQQ
ncbi:hypothetical protein BLA39750_02239 [Burkholderia lata]|uniref:Uncharacterized protein n=1 Tax=Burkholderia lata (strain ATCC 17760 / DSM 23089 / LMG 22485 / NCIMB 9086 / R18194 / 383) TaxID=482957 RepID=A0A6P2VXY0_BURL3|nr:hypothetical protein [Burkholderia lata]VWC96161.1 hypothetical protein BLA39750_02239 [Burkholderia lata]